MAPSLVLVLVTASCAVVCAAGCVRDPNLSTINDEGGANALEPGEGGAAADAAANDDAPLSDATSAACAAACPAAGGTCQGATCVIACTATALCTPGVTCPAGVPCHVTCTGKQVCGPVSCGSATSCKVECTGEQACVRVRSEAPQTVILCNGKDACKDSACTGDACSIQCWNEACKAEEVDCCAKQCTVNGLPGACN